MSNSKLQGSMEALLSIGAGINHQMVHLSSQSRSQGCYGCGICTSSCPVSLVGGALNPRRIVHLANIGQLTLEQAGSSIWHCLECNRCGNLCPNSVKPWSLIASLKREAISKGLISHQTYAALLNLKQELVTTLSNEIGMELAPTNATISSTPIELKPRYSSSYSSSSSSSYSSTLTNNYSLCFTCRECSSACPICFNTNEFDPLYFIRCYLFKLSPSRSSLWACLQCESCTQACSQSVKGHLVIKALQEEQAEFFNIVSQIKMRKVKEGIFSTYIDKANSLVGVGGTNS
ncbi:MAG: 4Fe-4S dicluster domain-containing protein [Desulfamplus sp.]|nr:4Fe-4S dicluster domain-containing protein [Desulfamplus sp.]